MAANNEKAKELINKLKGYSKKIDEITQIWRKKRRIRPQNGDMVKEFLTEFMGAPAYLSLSQSKKSLDIKNFLNNITDNSNDEEQKYIEFLKELEKKIVIVEEQKNEIQIISGKDIIVTVSYNTKYMIQDYLWENYSLKNQIQKFVKQNLKYSSFDIRTVDIQKSKKSKRILDGKRESKDQYTGIYLFDPFFNCARIQMQKKKKDQIFFGRFKIKSEQIQNFIHFQDLDEKNWINESDFNFHDPIDNLLSFIFKKENGSPQDQSTIKQYLQGQRLKLISDLSYNTKIAMQKIPILKWSNQLSAQIEKINTTKRKNQAQTQLLEDRQRKRQKLQIQLQQQKKQKQQCFKMGNSHKILRYVYYMAKNQNHQGLQYLNRNIPLLNQELVKKAINFVEKKIKIKKLFPQLEKYFKAFCVTKRQKIQKGLKEMGTPNGILFYGPPGTGKTRLTEDLPELMGMNPISIGISSSQFMKELVGQAKGTVSSYLRRPELSPHLICCFSIDEIDAIVPDRRKKQSKSGQATAMFLASLGGNQNIENLLVFGSTNFRNQIDEAILRRFTPSFYVQLPSPKDRGQIIKRYIPKLEDQTLNFLSKMTPNFSGAALQMVCHKLGLLVLNQEGYEQLTKSNLLEIIQQVGTDFKIKFGNETYPRLCKSLKKYIKMDLIRSAFNNLIIIQKSQDNGQFKIVFAKDEMQWTRQAWASFIQIKQIYINLDINPGSSLFQCIYLWIQQSISQQRPKVKVIRANSQSQAYKHHKKYSQPTILIVNLLNQSFLQQNVFLNQPKENLYVIYFVGSITGKIVFEMSKYQEIISTQEKIYSGRIIVDLTTENQPSMILQRKKTERCPIRIQKMPFLKKGVNNSKDALPQVVEYMTSQSINYIQMIDGQLMSDNNAFDDQAYQNIITSKIDEARNYIDSALIIDTSSMISVRRDVSINQNGQNISLGINEPIIYKKLIEQMRNFAYIQENSKRLIAIIVEDDQLLKMLKRDVKWPNSPEQMKNQFEQMKKKDIEADKKKFRRCERCGQTYTGEQNQKQKTCRIHYGYFVNEQDYKAEYNLTLARARQNQKAMNMYIQDENKKKRYYYSCCFGLIGSEPCQNFYHWYGHQDEKDFQTPAQMAHSKQQQWNEARIRLLDEALNRSKEQRNAAIKNREEILNANGLKKSS